MPTARSNGYQLHYEVSGSGPPIVLHPGMYFLGEHWTLRGYTSVLGRDHTVVTIDPLGLGASDAPHDPDAYRLERRVEDVLAVMDDLGADRAAFWGYSMGAWVGFGLAASAPRRCEALVLGAWDPVGGIETAYRHAVTRLGAPAGSDWVRALRLLILTDPHTTAIEGAVAAGGDAVATRLCHQGFEGQAGLVDRLTGDGPPMLLYAGTADPYHQNIQATAERLGARFVSMTDADHLSTWVRSGEILAHAVPFLASTHPATAAP